MPAPLAILSFLAITATKVGISIMLNPGRTADADLDSVYRERPKPIDPNNPPPPAQPGVPTNPIERPTVYYPPEPIYNPPSDSPRRPLPLPPRRLPTEGDDQSEIQTELGDVFTIEEWIDRREFGKLLWNPLSDRPLTIRQGFNTDTSVQFQNAVAIGHENYKRWLRAKLDGNYRKTDEYLDNYSFWDGTAWVMPERLRGLQGDLTVGFGVHALQRLGEIMSLQSKNCLFGVIDNIPNGWNVVAAEFPETELLSRELDNIELTAEPTTQEMLGVIEFPVTVPKDLTKLPTFDEMQADGVFERALDQASFDSADGDKYDREVNSLSPEQIEANMSPAFREKYYEDIETISGFISWQMRQLDGILGAYPINIKIEDNDLTQEGDQPLDITIPNIAEGLAELLENMVNQGQVNTAMIDMQTRLLMEIASNKKMGAMMSLALDSVVDYLGFKIAKKEKEIEFSFNPSANLETEGEVEFSEFLKPSTMDIPYDDYDDDTTLEIQLKELIEVARIVKAKSTRRVDLNNINSLKELFTSARDMLQDEGNEAIKSKFDEWLDEFEDGFTNRPTIQDPANPWGRDRSQRPRIRKLDNNGS